MTDHEDLIRRLRAYAQERYLGSRCPNLVHEAADAIKELVAERDKIEGDAIAFKIGCDEHVAALEADLTAARSALRKSMEYLGLLHQFMCDAHKCDFNEDRTVSWVAYMDHEVRKFSHDEKTIAAARAGEKADG